MNRLFLCGVMVLALGCGKKAEEDKSGGGDDTAKPTPKGDKAASAPDFSAWDQAGKAKAFQGSWLVKENGRIQAWNISGDKVQTDDMKEQKTWTLVIKSPCHAGLKTEKGAVYSQTYVSVGGKLRMGSGGYKKGKEAIFCDMSGATYVVGADGKCTHWKLKFREWEKAEGECGFKKNEEGKEVFFHADPNADEWMVEGDAIVPNGFATRPVEGDFAAAQAALKTCCGEAESCRKCVEEAK